MKSMKHENIVTYYASFVDNTDLCIVMDLCIRGKLSETFGVYVFFLPGSLLNIIKSIQDKRDITHGVFDESTIATILKDVLKGLTYIHENGLVHR